jgi:hypothetical protein
VNILSSPRPLLRRVAAALSATLALGAAIGLGGGVDAAPPAAGPGWHVLVYAVDDSASDLPLGWDLDEMVEASRSGISFTVYADSSDHSVYPSSESSDYVPLSAQAVVIEIAAGAATITDELGELDSGSPDTLAWFVATGLQRHPTDRAALVVWDHGDGWRAIGVDKNVTADGRPTMSSALDASELGRATAAGLAAAGRSRFDLLILDACLMANVDVASQTTGVAGYLIASEELAPDVGLNYEAFSIFATNPGADAGAIFDALAAGYEAGAVSSQNDLTLSLTDLSRAPALDQAVAAFAQAAAADVVADPAPYRAAAGSSLRYGVYEGHWYGYLDLGQYLGLLTDVDPAVAAARDALLAALDAAVIDTLAGSNYVTSTGLTMFLPEAQDDEYEAFPTAQLWRPFLDALYGVATQAVPANAGFAADALTAQVRPEGGYVIEAAVTDGFAGSVQLLAALPDSAGNLSFFAATSGDVIAGRATAALLPTLTTISDGTAAAVPFTRFVTQGGVAHEYSQFLLQRQDGSTANLNWDRLTDAASGPFTVVDPYGTVNGYTPMSGDLAYPIVMIQRPGADDPVREATAPALDLALPWTVADAPLVTGQQVFVELQLLDAAGAVVDSLNGYVTIGR